MAKANLIYVNPEAAITWRDTGGTHLLTLTSVGAGAGRQGAQHEFGTDARARRYNWRAFVQFATTPVLGETVDIYAKTGDGTHFDNDDGTGDIALSAEDKLRNLTLIGSIVVDEATADLEMSASGSIEIDAEKFMPVIFNNTADALTSTASEHGFDLVPVPDEVQ